MIRDCQCSFYWLTSSLSYLFLAQKLFHDVSLVSDDSFIFLCTVTGVKSIPEDTPAGRILLRKEVLRLVINLSSSVGTKNHETSLLTWGWNCLWAPVCSVSIHPASLIWRVNVLLQDQGEVPTRIWWHLSVLGSVPSVGSLHVPPDFTPLRSGALPRRALHTSKHFFYIFYILTLTLSSGK